MKIFRPVTRSEVLTSTFFVLLSMIVSSWIFMRFVHFDAQYRVLDPAHYILQVLTAEDYRRLADPNKPIVTLTDGSSVQKTPAWYTIMLPNYVRTADGLHYVLVTTKGTAHVLPYVEHYFILFGLISVSGLAISLWNSRSVRRESSTIQGPLLSA